MNPLEQFIKNLDPSVKKKLEGFASSAQGQNLLSQLGSVNKNDLAKKLSSMSKEERDAIAAKLANETSVAELLKKLR